MILKLKRKYLLIQHSTVSLCNGKAVFTMGQKLNIYLEFKLQRFRNPQQLLYSPYTKTHTKAHHLLFTKLIRILGHLSK
jgi:hypothetical protein